jgi:hypothetical protein
MDEGKVVYLVDIGAAFDEAVAGFELEAVIYEIDEGAGKYIFGSALGANQGISFQKKGGFAERLVMQLEANEGDEPKVGVFGFLPFLE